MLRKPWNSKKGYEVIVPLPKQCCAFFTKILHVPAWLEPARFVLVFVLPTLRHRVRPVYKLGEILTHQCTRFQDCFQDQLRIKPEQWLNTWYVRMLECIVQYINIYTLITCRQQYILNCEGWWSNLSWLVHEYARRVWRNKRKTLGGINRLRIKALLLNTNNITPTILWVVLLIIFSHTLGINCCTQIDLPNFYSDVPYPESSFPLHLRLHDFIHIQL